MQTLDILSRYCSPEDGLKEVLREWIQSKDSILTWETLSGAVAAVGETDLLQSINQRMRYDSPQQLGMILSVSQYFLIFSHVASLPN